MYSICFWHTISHDKIQKKRGKRAHKNGWDCGDEYTLSDISIYPWYGSLVIGNLYNAQEFLDVQKYEHVIRWAEIIKERPAVKRGERVNRVWGKKEERVYERHNASDIPEI